MGEQPDVIVVGAGPVGQTAALLLARWGVRSLVLDAREARDEVGSRAIVQQRDVIDVWDAVGVGRQIAAEGITWRTARTYYRDRELFAVDFVDQGRSPFPPFVNISQARTETLLDRRIAERVPCGPSLEPSGHRDAAGRRRRVRDVRDRGRRRGSSGPAYVIVCGGARCDDLRTMLGLTFDGETFDDQFLICDIRTDLPGLGVRAAVLLRSGLEPGSPGAGPPVSRWHLPHRLAGATRLRPRRRCGLRRAGPADPGDRRRPALRAGVEVGVPLPFPGGAADASGAGAAGRRQRPSRLAVRRPRPELRRAGRGERRLEAGLRPARLGARLAAGHLPHRAPRGSAREHRGHHRDHAVPGTAYGRGPPPPPGHARAGRTEPAARAMVDSGRLAESFWYHASPLTTPSVGHPFTGVQLHLPAVPAFDLEDLPVDNQGGADLAEANRDQGVFGERIDVLGPEVARSGQEACHAQEFGAGCIVEPGRAHALWRGL